MEQLVMKNKVFFVNTSLVTGKGFKCEFVDLIIAPSWKIASKNGIKWLLEEAKKLKRYLCKQK